MKKSFLFIVCILYLSVAFSQPWKKNFGIDGGGWWGLTGMSSLKLVNNPLVSFDLNSSYNITADFYAEFLKTRTRKNGQWGKTAPGFGIKTKLDWDFFYADNSGSGGGESIGMNFLDVPLLFEYCLSFHEGITWGYTSPENSTTTVYDHSYYSRVITNTTPSQYHPGGSVSSTAIFIYGGPQICYLFKSFHDVDGNKYDPKLKNSYLGLVVGFTFWLNQVNFDLSYQKGLQSIYNNKDLYINGFLFKVGINFSRRFFIYK